MADCGKKRRYNTFRATSNPLPPKRSLRRRVRTVVNTNSNHELTNLASSVNLTDELLTQKSQTQDPLQSMEVRFDDHEGYDYSDFIDETFGEENDEDVSPVYESSFEHERDVQEFIYSSDGDETDPQSRVNDDVPQITADNECDKTTEDPPIYPSCPLRLSESVLLIMTLAIRHKLTGEALADIIKLIDLHCIPGTQSFSIKTLRELKSYFVNSKEMLDVLYYCSCCFGLLTEECDFCPFCHTDLSSPSAKRYFLVLPIGHQLSKFFSRKYLS